MAKEEMPEREPDNKELEKERYELLRRLESIMEMPMVLLGFVWLILLIVELIWELHPMLLVINNIIWIIFILDFIIKFILAPVKVPFLKSNVLTIISLAVPALRIFRLARAFRMLRTVRAMRSLRLAKVLGTINRSMRSLAATMERRAFGYVLILTMLIVLVGAAGMYAFEKDKESGLNSYGEALWWTAMLITSIGSEYWPKTPEGRVLCLFLALYGFAVLGYFTATLATFFIGRDAANKKGEISGAKQVEELHREIILLREEMAGGTKREK